jgi:hypothetical protein
MGGRELLALLLLSVAVVAAAAPKLKPRDVRNALHRVFGPAVTQGPAPAAVGDFNGDGSEDLAAVVRVAPKMLEVVNDELANWLRQDATGGRTGRVIVGQDDVLLAVIHGHGPQGWRHGEARQGYLVRYSDGMRRGM